MLYGSLFVCLFFFLAALTFSLQSVFVVAVAVAVAVFLFSLL